jgi:hypothetical protein
MRRTDDLRHAQGVTGKRQQDVPLLRDDPVGSVEERRHTDRANGYVACHSGTLATQGHKKLGPVPECSRSNVLCVAM